MPYRIFSAYLVAFAVAGMPALANAQQKLIVEETEADITVTEGGDPVFMYRKAPVEPPEDAEGAAPHACYIHPLFDTYGNAITEDFPADHRHHRGVFWAWPKVDVDGETVSLWSIDGAHVAFERWTARQGGAGKAVIGIQNAWIRESTGTAFVMEDVRITVWPAAVQARAIDLDITLRNVTDAPVVIQGETTDDKGYGGLTYRPDAAMKPFRFSSKRGLEDEDAFIVPSPWVDLSFKQPRSSRYEGLAIFQHPSNPGYPHDGWMIRHYGLLVASWPHLERVPLDPGESVRLRYRLYVHLGSAEQVDLEGEYEEYLTTVLSDRESTAAPQGGLE